MITDVVTAVPLAFVALSADVLDSTALGASALDVAANTPRGQNPLAHALSRPRHDGWMSPPPANADQRHLVDEIEHPEFVEAAHHEFAARCGKRRRPLAAESAR